MRNAGSLVGRWDGAACLGRDPAWWDLKSGQRRRLSADNEAAQRICRSCPVRVECLRRALEEGTDGQIRGGQPFWTAMRVDRCMTCGGNFLRSRSRGNKANYCRVSCRPRVGWAAS